MSYFLLNVFFRFDAAFERAAVSAMMLQHRSFILRPRGGSHDCFSTHFLPYGGISTERLSRSR